MGNPFKALWNWITGGAKHLGDLVAKLWTLAEPYFKEILSETAQSVWDSLQTLAVQACQYVEAQGLPTDDAKKAAFLAYMTDKAKDQVAVLKTKEINLLRENALAIFEKAQSGLTTK